MEDTQQQALIVWDRESYHSGTQVVIPKDSFGRPYYHIGHLAADNDGDHGRTEVARELQKWLNDGVEPWWADMLYRKADSVVVTPHGCEIEAIGPLIDNATPPSWGNWIPDPSDDAKITRGLMINALMQRNLHVLNSANI